MKIPRTESRAFTLVEVLIIVAVILTLALLFLPGLVMSRARAYRLNCFNNLRSMGLVFKTWELDSGGRLPSYVSLKNGGAMEAVNDGNLAFVFEVMSNELSTPKVLVCPADRKRVAATNFLVLRSTNISYFAGLDVTNTATSAFLSGDFNITNAAGLKAGFLLASTNDPVGWTHMLHNGVGNIGLADGSVQQFSTVRLREAVGITGFPTNRLLMP